MDRICSDSCCQLFVLFIFNKPNIQKYTQPLFVSIFICHAFFYRFLGGSMISIFYLFIFWLIDNLIQESKSNNEREISEQENDSIEHNEDNHNAEEETPQNQEQNTQPESNKNGDQSINEKLNSIKFMTLLFVLCMWITYLGEGITDHSSWRYNRFLERKVINYLFYRLFAYATYQYIYGMFVLNDNPPKWLYFFYMIPTAVLYPLSSVISYYVGQKGSFYLCSALSWSIMFHALISYFAFKMLFQFVNSCKEEGELKNKIISIGVFAVGFLWLVFVKGIQTMGNYPPISDIYNYN